MDGEGQAAVHLRQDRSHRLALCTACIHDIKKKCELYQEREQAAKQLVQLEMCTADLNIMRHILSSGKDVPRKFWRYLGTLIDRGQTPTVVDKRRGLEVDALD